MSVRKVVLVIPLSMWMLNISVHGGPGIWGVIAVCFFDEKKGIFYKWDKRSGVVSVGESDESIASKICPDKEGCFQLHVPRNHRVSRPRILKNIQVSEAGGLHGL